MATSDIIEVEGIVKDILGGGKYAVYVENMDLTITAYAAGKMKRFNIKIIPGDIVTVELNPYEPTQGRITYRSINKKIKNKKLSNTGKIPAHRKLGKKVGSRSSVRKNTGKKK